jgi:hypothetical protein
MTTRYDQAEELMHDHHCGALMLNPAAFLPILGSTCTAAGSRALLPAAVPCCCNRAAAASQVLTRFSRLSGDRAVANAPQHSRQSASGSLPLQPYYSYCSEGLTMACSSRGHPPDLLVVHDAILCIICAAVHHVCWPGAVNACGAFW